MRTVGGALHAEVKRLRTEIGPRRDRLVVTNFYGLSVSVPSIHPWVERIITEGAEIDASIVEAFMELDRQLANMRAYLNLFVQAGQKATLARQTTDGVRKQMLENWVNERDVAPLLARQPTERPHDFEQASEFAQHHYLECYDRVVGVLDQLDGRFGRVE
jgi:hypothetical protein